MSPARPATLRWALLAALALGVGAACAGEAPDRWPEVRPDVPSPAVGDAPRVPAPGPGAAASPARLEGAWVGAPCGRRNYARRLELAAGGAARMEERISPCPAGARCVWSGVEVVEGRWRRRDDAVLLELDAVTRPMAVDAPSRLTVASTAGEVVLEEEGGCRYRREEPPPDAGQPAERAPLP